MATKIPSWVIPAALAAVAVGLVWSTREASAATPGGGGVPSGTTPQMDDIVGVPVNKILGIGPVAAAVIPSNAIVALQVKSINGPNIENSQAVGYMDPVTGEYMGPRKGGMPVGLANLSAPIAAVVSVYRSDAGGNLKRL